MQKATSEQGWKREWAGCDGVPFIWGKENAHKENTHAQEQQKWVTVTASDEEAPGTESL